MPQYEKRYDKPADAWEVVDTIHDHVIATTESERLADLILEKLNPYVEVKIAKVLMCGELFAPVDSQDVIDQVGRLMDKACTWDIVGDTLFRGADGKYYAVEIQGVFLEASEDYVEDVKEKLEKLNAE